MIEEIREKFKDEVLREFLEELASFDNFVAEEEKERLGELIEKMLLSIEDAFSKGKALAEEMEISARDALAEIESILPLNFLGRNLAIALVLRYQQAQLRALVLGVLSRAGKENE